MEAEKCVYCGEIVPEGVQVCKRCENDFEHKRGLFNTSLMDMIHDDITWCGDFECTYTDCERNIANKRQKTGLFSAALFRGTENCPLQITRKKEKAMKTYNVEYVCYDPEETWDETQFDIVDNGNFEYMFNEVVTMFKEFAEECGYTAAYITKIYEGVEE